MCLEPPNYYIITSHALEQKSPPPGPWPTTCLELGHRSGGRACPHISSCAGSGQTRVCVLVHCSLGTIRSPPPFTKPEGLGNSALEAWAIRKRFRSQGETKASGADANLQSSKIVVLGDRPEHVHSVLGLLNYAGAVAQRRTLSYYHHRCASQLLIHSTSSLERRHPIIILVLCLLPCAAANCL